MKKQKKKDAHEQSTRQLMGIDDITDYSIATRMGELVFFIIKPTNISVLPDSGVGARIYALLNVVKGMAEIEMLALNSKESFENNKAFYRRRVSEEELTAKLNFYVDADFDVDAAFGTFVLTDKNDDWLNIYANYDIAEDRPCDTLELTLCKGDGSEESWSYQLNAAEQDVLLRRMEEYCQQQTGMSLHDYAQQFREEPEQQQGPVMKL